MIKSDAGGGHAVRRGTRDTERGVAPACSAEVFLILHLLESGGTNPIRGGAAVGGLNRGGLNRDVLAGPRVAVILRNEAIWTRCDAL